MDIEPDEEIAQILLHLRVKDDTPAPSAITAVAGNADDDGVYDAYTSRGHGGSYSGTGNVQRTTTTGLNSGLNTSTRPQRAASQRAYQAAAAAAANAAALHNASNTGGGGTGMVTGRRYGTRTAAGIKVGRKYDADFLTLVDDL